MFQKLFLIVAALAVVSYAASPGLAQSKLGKGLEIGRDFAGVLGGSTKTIQFVKRENGSVGADEAYTSSIPITLKAGQSISVTATVVGKSRHVGIQLFDPQGKILVFDQESHAHSNTKTCVRTVDEVSADGAYRIVVFSDAIGPFTLRAESDSEEEDVAKLEDRIISLREELKGLEAKVKALKGKSRQ